MQKFKIEITESNGKVNSAYLVMALGPWPFNNWSHGGIWFLGHDAVDKAINLRDGLLVMPEELQYWGFVCKNANIEKAKSFKERCENTREYSI